MTVDEAVPFFEMIPKIHRKKKTIQDVGLGYIAWSAKAPRFRRSPTHKAGIIKDTGNTFISWMNPLQGFILKIYAY
jgi:excinuclease ABC subunit A